MTRVTAEFQQTVTIEVSVVVGGTMSQFEMRADELRERIAEHVRSLLPPALAAGVRDLYAGRGPSGSRFYFPAQVRAGDRPEGLAIPVVTLYPERVPA